VILIIKSSKPHKRQIKILWSQILNQQNVGGYNKKINKKVWKTNRNKKNQDQIWYENKMIRDEIKKIKKIIKKTNKDHKNKDQV